MGTLLRGSLAVLVAAGAAAFIDGCSGGGSKGATRAPSTGTAHPVAVVLDGNVDEWPQEAAGVADGRYLYVRFAVSEAQYTLEAGDRTLSLFLDIDGDPATGLPSAASPIPEAAGADLQIDFSPRGADGAFKQGVALQAFDRAGKATPIRAGDADFSFAPTFAAGWYEARISRRLPKIGGLGALASSGGRVRGVAVLFDNAGQLDGYADPFEVALPPLGSSEFASTDIPAPQAGAIRVMSYNVFKGRPIDRPEAFARIFRAVAPDVVLLQEWDRGDANEIKAWFTTLVPSGSGWQVVRPAGGDVAIVSRYPLTALGPASLDLPASGGQPHPVRFVAASTTTPAGDVVLACTHLKCCGGMGGPEDATRLAETQAINGALRQALAGKSPIRVVGGDLNLVATRTPLDTLAAGLDAGGGSLSIIEAPVLGDPGIFCTWSDPTTDFVPGRLDYLMLGGGAAQTVQAFVLDTGRLSDDTLARHGLRRDDSRQSDHMPVVVDVVPRTN